MGQVQRCDNCGRLREFTRLSNPWDYGWRYDDGIMTCDQCIKAEATSMTNQPLDLAAIHERTEKATPGPWQCALKMSPLENSTVRGPARAEGDNPVKIPGQPICLVPLEANSTFIAHAREDIPALLAEVERQRAERELFMAILHSASRPKTHGTPVFLIEAMELARKSPEGSLGAPWLERLLARYKEGERDSDDD